MTQAGKPWLFAADRGGTFTDVVAFTPEGEVVTAKVLSESPDYEDATTQAILQILKRYGVTKLAAASIAPVRLGTTVATNALLERKGARVCLVITRGFGDLLRIGYQNRPKLFALDVHKPTVLYEEVVEVAERLDREGKVLLQPELTALARELRRVYAKGIRSLAVVLMHAWRNPAHEEEIGALARQIGFTQISLSSRVMPLIKIVSRGQTTLVDAYLNPVLRQYVETLRVFLRDSPLMFMQSHGGLTRAEAFTGKDAIFSGPAGGVIGYSHVARLLGYDKAIGFDMGGTSTDVSRYDGAYEKMFEAETAGVPFHADMLHIVTVAAGGGSILHFDGQKFQVGPDSAGADPGPACYRRGGPLTITDANLMLGRLLPRFFPAIFGPQHDRPLDVAVVQEGFAALAETITQQTGKRGNPRADGRPASEAGPSLTDTGACPTGPSSIGAESRLTTLNAAEVAEGFIRIANETMVRAIKKISVARGFNIHDYTLFCFGGAGAQHACALARSLSIKRVVLHPLAGVLSAYGLALAEVIKSAARGLLVPFTTEQDKSLSGMFAQLEEPLQREVAAAISDPSRIRFERFLDLRPVGVETPETVPYTDFVRCRQRFYEMYQQHYGVALPEANPLEILNIRVMVIGQGEKRDEPEYPITGRLRQAEESMVPDHVAYFNGQPQCTPVFRREDLLPGDEIIGPAIVVEPNSTIVVEPGFRACMNSRRHLLLESTQRQQSQVTTARDPILLEIFYNLLMSVAEQMGCTLVNTAHSTNIKERLDFSCAVFDAHGALVANAPHIPVHLGSMQASVQATLAANRATMHDGDAYVTNNPFRGGAHLPDVTVITPIFDARGELIFVVANRGHHADIGGITPGSMPPWSKTIAEEGVVLDNFKLVSAGVYHEEQLLQLLSAGSYPARNLEERRSDLRAQLAANQSGRRELTRMVSEYGLEMVKAYMQHIQDYAAQSMQQALLALLGDEPILEQRFTDYLDDGAAITVTLTIARGAQPPESVQATVDFTGTSAQLSGNLNTPPAVVQAAVLYVFRTLITADLPLNAGCLRPIRIIIPPGSLLHPAPGAAVVGGNVETSQRIVDTLYGALDLVAASQGTMNNFTFGKQGHGGFGYYETICGGAGAGSGFDGESAVHTHMTNTRITDPEVLEYRYPDVRLEKFAIRRGSGGEGVFRGGDGAIRQVRFLSPCQVSILSERRGMSPYGLHGASAGSQGINLLIRSDGSQQALPAKVQLQVSPGEQIAIYTPGGGGYHPSPAQWASLKPAQVRQWFRENRWPHPTAGLCAGYAQMNLAVVPAAVAGDFQKFCLRNPAACPLLETLPVGSPFSRQLAPGADLRFDLPLYRIYREGRLEREVTDLEACWRIDSVAFLLGCSFTFESALQQAGIPCRHIELHCNVPMYITSRSCLSVGVFHSPLVVSMRPISRQLIQRAHEITAQFANAHGAPLTRPGSDEPITDPGELGIQHLPTPDFGDAVPLYADEVPLFWPCGVTSQMALMNAALPLVMTHAPGHMFISDRRDEEFEEDQ